MALVTDQDRQTIQGVVKRANEASMVAIELGVLAAEVRARIKDVDMNNGTDFVVITAAYTPAYDAVLVRLKTIVQGLPRWDTV